MDPAADDQEPGKKPVTVQVNEKPVELPSHKVTGLQIKQAAIAQGVEIQLDFELVQEAHGEHPARTIKDDEEITVNDHSKFVAEEKHHPVTVHVNTKPVELPSHRVTGLQIKEAAIAQGVEIKPDFELTWEAHDGEPDQNVTDAQKITVNKHSVFSAVDNEEDS